MLQLNLKPSAQKKIDTIIMVFPGKNEPKATLPGLAVALLYHGVLRVAEVQMIEMEDKKIETTGARRVIEVMFKHTRKQRNKGFIYYVPSKFYPMFSWYLEKICQEMSNF